jgi:putative ABC transport system permease protein
MNVLVQVLAITALNLRSLAQRWLASLVVVVGVAGVVAVLVALLALAQGFARTLERTGQPDRAIVLRGGSASELSSGFDSQAVRLIEDLPGIARDGGRPLASGELYLVADVPKRATGTPANLPVRGLGAQGFALRPELRIVEGRRFEPGRAELIAGRAASSEFAGLALGERIRLRDAALTVVGIFTADGGGNESEVWLDLATAQDLFRGPGAVSSVRVRLESAAALPVLEAALRGEQRLDANVQDEPTYYAAQSESLAALIRGFGYGVAAIMGIGALFAALNTMYSAVAARTVEIGTLRALGFGGLPVVVSVMVEATLLSLAGGVIGGGVAWLAFDGMTVSTLNNVSFSQVAFDYAVTPDLVVQGIVLALLVGLAGGLLPAWRAARLPVTVALRSG